MNIAASNPIDTQCEKELAQAALAGCGMLKASEYVTAVLSGNVFTNCSCGNPVASFIDSRHLFLAEKLNGNRIIPVGV